MPTTPTLYEQQRNLNAQETIGFTSAYTRPMDDGSKLRAGYELSLNRPDQDTALRRGPSEAALAPVPGLSNRFEAEQTVHALYTTYERPFGEKLSAQFGLRLEQADDLPDTLLLVGLNDKRVAPWFSAKFAARALDRFGDRRLVLLR